MDLEGIVCKRKDSPDKVTEKPWRYRIKVKNSRYSQLEGCEELLKLLQVGASSQSQFSAQQKYSGILPNRLNPSSIACNNCPAKTEM